MQAWRWLKQNFHRQDDIPEAPLLCFISSTRLNLDLVDWLIDLLEGKANLLRQQYDIKTAIEPSHLAHNNLTVDKSSDANSSIHIIKTINDLLTTKTVD